MEAKASARYIKGSPQKARLVIDLIRGKNVEEALSILQFSNKRAAQPIAKALRSAIANAEQQSSTVSLEDLHVSRAYVDLGPTKWRRRIRPASQGRIFREMRRQSHITVQVSSREQ